MGEGKYRLKRDLPIEFFQGSQGKAIAYTYVELLNVLSGSLVMLMPGFERFTLDDSRQSLLKQMR